MNHYRNDYDNDTNTWTSFDWFTAIVLSILFLFVLGWCAWLYLRGGL